MTEHTAKVINLDMDGSIADLYGVENWLDYLHDENPFPYATAKPLVNMSILARLLNKLHRNGYIINIISWLAKTTTPSYDEAVTAAKIAWLKKHLPSVKFDNIFIVPYGTPKHTLANGILFDDEEKNRTDWGKNAYDVTDILGMLRAIA